MTSYRPRRMPEASANGSGWDYRGCCDSSGFLLLNGVVATNRGRVQNHLIADPSTAGASVESVREIGRKSSGPREEFLTPSHTFQRRARGSQLWAATIRKSEATVAGPSTSDCRRTVPQTGECPAEIISETKDLRRSSRSAA